MLIEPFERKTPILKTFLLLLLFRYISSFHHDDWKCTKSSFEAVQEAFGDLRGYLPTSYEEWEHWMVKWEGVDPSLWFLAWDEQELAGCSLCDYRAGSGWVEQLAVRRPWRRQGLGMALLLYSFGAFYRRGTGEVRLLVDAESLTGATRLYERAWMQSIRQYDNYEKEVRAGKGFQAAP